MLVVKLEIWPGGDVSRAREIGRAEIANVSDLAPVSDYEYSVWLNEQRVEGLVVGHTRSRGAWALVLRVLTAALRKGWSLRC